MRHRIKQFLSLALLVAVICNVTPIGVAQTATHYDKTAIEALLTEDYQYYFTFELSINNKTYLLISNNPFKVETNMAIDGSAYQEYVYDDDQNQYIFNRSYTSDTTAVSTDMVLDPYLNYDMRDTLNNVVYAANTSAPDTGLSSTVGVNISSTLLDVTVTPNIDIKINPNTGEATAGTISITNNGTAPVSVTSGDSLTSSNGHFNLVSPSSHTDWSALSSEESNDLAFTLNYDTGWSSIVNGSKTTGDTNVLSGTIAPATTATVIVTNLYHGNTFTGTVNDTAIITWSFDLQ